MKTATTIKHESPSLMFGDLKSGDMFLHNGRKDSVYIKTNSPDGTSSNCVLLTGAVSGVYGRCFASDPVQLVKQANFIV